jgi:polyhydroxyalkanoate synthesis repressor PhaR
MGAAVISDGGRLEIRKYANRRYYDAAHSRHLTLKEIRALVRNGQELSIIDATSSRDITTQVLAQIILDFEPEKLDGLPAGLLASLLQSKSSLPSPAGSAVKTSPPEVKSPATGEASDLLEALAIARQKLAKP